MAGRKAKDCWSRRGIEWTDVNVATHGNEMKSSDGRCAPSQFRRRFFFAVAAAAALSPVTTGAALAAYDHYLTSTIVGTMTQAEARSFAGAVDKALRSTEDGEEMHWRAPATPRHAVTNATITPLQTKRDHGQPCRQLRSELKRASNEESWTGWFCQQIDGRWRARAVDQ